ncbi:MAG TPA: flavodoxin family protein [Spirochaetia bacterium]
MATVIGIVGSPNREGRTRRVVDAALEGAARSGAAVELVQMADHVVGACRDCVPWVCAERKKCTYPDPAFDLLSEKLHACAGLVLGSPIYWWDTSAMVRSFFLKVFRVFARSAPFQGLPSFGIGVAGGTGNGLVSGLRPLYHFFQVMQMRALAPVPVTRFTIDSSVTRAAELGAELGRMAEKRAPFASTDERLLWYDRMPYIGMGRLEERRFLAGDVVSALPAAQGAPLAARLVAADARLSAGEAETASAEVTAVYEEAVGAFDAARG